MLLMSMWVFHKVTIGLDQEISPKIKIKAGVINKKRLAPPGTFL